MRSVNISLDLYSCLLCLILMCYLLFSHTRRTASSRCFILMCTLNIIISLGDITNWACEGYAKPWFPAVLNAGSMLFYFCIGPLLLTFTAYICACLGPQVTVHRGFWYVESALCGAQMLFSLLSLWNGMYFTILPGNVYSRGSALWLALLVPFLMFAGDSVLLAVYRKYLRRKDIFFLVCYIVLPMALNSFQVFHYGIALLNTGISISLLLIFINIQSERELQLQKQEKSHLLITFQNSDATTLSYRLIQMANRSKQKYDLILAFFCSLCIVLSTLFVFEPFYLDPEIEAITVSSFPEDSYFVKLDDGFYMLYVSGEEWGSVINPYTDDFKHIPIYPEQSGVLRSSSPKRDDTIDWKYKSVNGKCYKRLYNYTRQEWIGEWIPC